MIRASSAPPAWWRGERLVHAEALVTSLQKALKKAEARAEAAEKAKKDAEEKAKKAAEEKAEEKAEEAEMRKRHDELMTRLMTMPVSDDKRDGALRFLAESDNMNEIETMVREEWQRLKNNAESFSYMSEMTQSQCAEMAKDVQDEALSEFLGMDAFDRTMQATDCSMKAMKAYKAMKAIGAAGP